MSEMVEKVARAIWLSETSDGWTDDPDERMHDWSGKLIRPDAFHAAARAAIEAMREPTEAMTDHPSYTAGEWSRYTLEAAIDAALSDSPAAPSR